MISASTSFPENNLILSQAKVTTASNNETSTTSLLRKIGLVLIATGTVVAIAGIVGLTLVGCVSFTLGATVAGITLAITGLAMQILFSEKKKETLFQKTTEGLPECPEVTFDELQWEELMHTERKIVTEEKLSWKKYYGQYCGAYLYNQSMGALGWHAWDTILRIPESKTQIVLGALPIKSALLSRQDLETLKAEGIEAILSVTELFENQTTDGITSNPITPEEWVEADILQLQLGTPDFETIPLKTIQRGVEFIRWNIENGRSVYVHCKAGRGRSALILMCYLIRYQDMSSKQAYAHVQEHRKQAGFSGDKYASLLDYENRVQNDLKKVNIENLV
ncbi:MAG: dual specificity protein phosphatase family protein [Parachlamydiaceae bacterium]|nr:dual specificity protein phosphatase family protein [Parachlamydiaceae bacterium]